MWKNINSYFKAYVPKYMYGKNLALTFSMIQCYLINGFKPGWLLLTVTSHRVKILK